MMVINITVQVIRSLLLMMVMIFLVLGMREVSGQSNLSLSQRLDRCLALTSHEPSTALSMAHRWRQQGSEMYPYATACESMIEFYAGRFTDAALGLKASAPFLSLLGTEKAIWVYATICWSWLRADRPDRAEEACTEALHFAPHDVDLLIDRAFSYVGQEKYQQALADLTHAIQYAANFWKVYQYRASVHSHLRQFEAALHDINTALDLKPEDPDALLQRGLIWIGLGKLDQAQRDWHQIIALVPDTPIAQTARRYLQTILELNDTPE